MSSSNDRKCFATHNMWGYPLMRGVGCGGGFVSGPAEAHRILDDLRRICGRAEDSRRRCGHHEPDYDEFHAWAEGVRQDEVLRNS